MYSKVMKRIFLITALLALSLGQAHAQRCLTGMRGIGLRGGMVNSNGYYFGADFSSYMKGGNKRALGVTYLRTSPVYRTQKLPVTQITAEGGYSLNFLSDKGKTLFFYLGASAVAGYETVNGGKKRLFDGAVLQNKDAFIYGCAATLDMEVYLSDAFCLTASVRERFMWGGSTGRFRTEYGIGIKFILD